MLKTLAATWGPTLGQWAPRWPAPAGSKNNSTMSSGHAAHCILGPKPEGNMK